MSRNHFYFWIFCIAPMYIYFLKPISTGDLSIWVALGRDTLNSMSLVVQDTYTFVESQTHFIYPILIAVPYALIHKYLGFNLLVCLHAMVPAVWVLLWYKNLKKTSGLTEENNIWNGWSLFIFTISMFGALLIYIPRPALVATIPLLFSYYFITNRREKAFTPKEIALLFAMEVLWVNLHGSFIMLPVLLGWESGFLFLKKEFKLVVSRAATSLLLLAGCLVNPFFSDVFPYITDTARISKARGLNEWFLPTQFDYPLASWLFYLCSAALFFAVFRKRKNWNLSYFSDPFFLIWLMGFFAIRNTVFLFLFFPLFAFRYFPETQPKINSPAPRRLFNYAFLGVMLVAVLLLTPALKPQIFALLSPENRSVYHTELRSEKINAFLQTKTGNIFNGWEYGSDLALEQPNKYFIDTRNVIFPDRINLEYEKVASRPAKNKDLLKKYDIKYFIVNDKQFALLNWLEQTTGCTKIIQDDLAYLFECDPKAYQD